eukprot:TRINITY_DN6398_c0_g1_i1.p1 TRINITY_DN6398_c0_g1~~TRINITY_DN6398_c0_g1_i1.p1  ORF type:complete len:306 (+),score=37.64 TRINITY_DN6398_c0_g1_i1:126-1043(+)
MIRRPPRSTQGVSSAASDVYKRQYQRRVHGIQKDQKMVSAEVPMEDYLSCRICLCFAENAVETECCHNVFCEECINKIKQNNGTCPMCRKVDFSFSPSFFVRKIVDDKLMPCPFGCKKELKKSEIAAHRLDCECNEFKCKYCEFKGKKEVFMDHLVMTHEAMLFGGVESKKEKSKSVSRASRKKPIPDVLNGELNKNGDLSKIGVNGKFYCGQRLDVIRCSCCNGFCGKTNGCNCSACMALDRRLRNLPKGYLVNDGGHICKYDSKLQQFYCSTLRKGGRCSQENSCKYCRRMLLVKARYQKYLL